MSNYDLSGEYLYPIYMFARGTARLCSDTARPPLQVHYTRTSLGGRILRNEPEGSVMLLFHRFLVGFLELNLLRAGERDLASATAAPARTRLLERRIGVLALRIRKLIRAQLRVFPTGTCAVG